MSGNKMTDLKNSDDLNLDSGFISGEIDKDFLGNVYSGEISSKPEEAEPPKTDEKEASILDLDTGVVNDDVCDELAKCVVSMNLVDYDKEVASGTATSVRPHATDLPLELLFQQDDDGDTQLHIAAYHGYEKPVSTLIRVCPNKELLNVCNDYGQTALHLAVMSRNPIITRMLVLAGADIGIRDRRGDTPLHKATALSNVKCIQALLIPVPAHEQQRKIYSVLNQKNYNGQACVHVAATLGHIESLQALLFYGADINSRENLAGWTALHIAASRGDGRLAAHLQRCAGVEAHALDYAGRSPRRLARRTSAAALFVRHADSDDDSDSDDDMYDEEVESLFDKYSSQSKSIVA